MAEPLVSVLLCNYNHGRYLRKCLSGLVRQTYRNIEIAITDDGSTDGSQDIIREHVAADSRIVPNFFPANRGIKAAFADSLSRTTGKYLYSGASDDFVFNEQFFAKAVAALEANPKPAGFYGITGIFSDEQAKVTYTCGTAEVSGYNTPRQCYEGFLKCRSVVTSPSTIWRRDLFLQSADHDFAALLEALGPQTDFYLNHAMAVQHGMMYEKTAFACQRVYEANSSYSARATLWDTSRRFEELEKRLRPLAPAYDSVEKDWVRWRAYWMADTIQKSRVLNPAK